MCESFISANSLPNHSGVAACPSGVSCGDRESGKVEEGKENGTTVEKNELHEEGCRKPPEPLSSVSPGKGLSPEVALDKGTEETQRENESRETKVERNASRETKVERNARDGREKIDERKRVLRERRACRER